MGIAGVEYHSVAVSGIIAVLGGPLVALYRGKALALEVSAGEQGQIGVFLTSPRVMLVQAPVQPSSIFTNLVIGDPD